MTARFQKKNFLNILIWFIAVVLLILTIRELPISDMLQRIYAISFSTWIILFCVNLVILFLAVKRWQILSNTFDIDISFARLFIIRQAGSTFSFVTPGPQFGEPLQAYWLYRDHGMRLDNIVALIGADRFIEIFINFSFLFLSIFLVIQGNIAADLSDAVLFFSLISLPHSIVVVIFI